jgi:hypothetical protein
LDAHAKVGKRAGIPRGGQHMVAMLDESARGGQADAGISADEEYAA